MTGYFSKSAYSVLALCLVLLGGCVSKPVLQAKNAATPVGVDLSGQWLLRGDVANRKASGGSGVSIVLPQRTSRARRNRDKAIVPAQVFLESGRSLKITQTGFGLFISYDRSVVEEYRFGENREIEIGPIEATRVSGWDGDSFVVETLDQEGATLFETWNLDATGDVLTRVNQIQQREKEVLREIQVFDRQE